MTGEINIHAQLGEMTDDLLDIADRQFGENCKGSYGEDLAWAMYDFEVRMRRISALIGFGPEEAQSLAELIEMEHKTNSIAGVGMAEDRWDIADALCGAADDMESILIVRGNLDRPEVKIKDFRLIA